MEGGQDPLTGIAAMADAALADGIGTTGRIGAAECHLFPAARLVAFARAWLEARFGEQPPSAAPAEGQPEHANAHERESERGERAQ